MKAKLSKWGIFGGVIVILALCLAGPTGEYCEHKSLMEDRVLNSNRCSIYCRGEK